MNEWDDALTEGQTEKKETGKKNEENKAWKEKISIITHKKRE